MATGSRRGTLPEEAARPTAWPLGGGGGGGGGGSRQSTQEGRESGAGGEIALLSSNLSWLSPAGSQKATNTV